VSFHNQREALLVTLLSATVCDVRGLPPTGGVGSGSRRSRCPAERSTRESGRVLIRSERVYLISRRGEIVCTAWEKCGCRRDSVQALAKKHDFTVLGNEIRHEDMVGEATRRRGSGVNGVFGEHPVRGIDANDDVVEVDLELGVKPRTVPRRPLTPAGPSKRLGRPNDTKNGISKTPSSAKSADAFSGSRKLVRYSLSSVFASDICPPLLNRVWRAAPAALSGKDNRCVKETCDMGDEQIRVLEQCAVTGVGIDDELGVGDVLGEKVRVDSGDHDIAVCR